MRKFQSLLQRDHRAFEHAEAHRLRLYGLVLAPASCQLLADLMLGREPIIDPAPYAPAGRLQ